MFHLVTTGAVNCTPGPPADLDNLLLDAYRRAGVRKQRGSPWVQEKKRSQISARDPYFFYLRCGNISRVIFFSNSW